MEKSKQYENTSSQDRLLEENNNILSYLILLQQKKQENDRQNDKLDRDYYSNMKEIEAKQQALNLEMEHMVWEEDQLQRRFLKNMDDLFQASGVSKEHPAAEPFFRIVGELFLMHSSMVHLEIDEENKVYALYRANQRNTRFEKKVLERRGDTVLLYEETFSKSDHRVNAEEAERVIQLHYYDRLDMSSFHLPLSIKMQMSPTSCWDQPSFDVSFSGHIAYYFQLEDISFSLSEFQLETLLHQFQVCLWQNGVSKLEQVPMTLNDLQAHFCFDEKAFIVSNLSSTTEKVQAYLSEMQAPIPFETPPLPKEILEMQEKIRLLEDQLEELSHKLSTEQDPDQLRSLAFEQVQLKNQRETEQLLVNVSLENFLLGTSSLLRSAAKHYFNDKNSKNVSISQDTVEFEYFYFEKGIKEVRTIHLFQDDLYQLREAVLISENSLSKYFLEAQKFSVTIQKVEKFCLQVDDIETSNDQAKPDYRGKIVLTHNVKKLMEPRFSKEKEQVFINRKMDFDSIQSLVSIYGRKREISPVLANVSITQLRGLLDDQWKNIGNKGTVKEKK